MPWSHCGSLPAALSFKVLCPIGSVFASIHRPRHWDVLLLLVPLMPNLPLAMLMLLLRFSISQMDVPTRQAFTIAMVAPNERSAAAGITGIARTLGASLSPLFAGMFLSRTEYMSLPFIVAGVLKIIYDLILYKNFKSTLKEN